MVKGTLNGRKVTFLNVSLPNVNQITYLENILEKIDSFSEGLLIVGGDFNLILEPEIDTSTKRGHLPFSTYRRFRKILNEYQLIDIWRAHNPSARDYTFYSNTHQTYSRIDFFM